MILEGENILGKMVTRDGIKYYQYTCSFCGHEILGQKGEKENITYCSHCKKYSPWILKPKTERILFELQEEYLNNIDQSLFETYAQELKKPRSEQNNAIIEAHKANMNQEILSKMFLTVRDYSGSLLKKYIKRKAFFLPYDEFMDKIQEITYRWYEQFTKRPGFKIKGSWAGQLNWKIIEVLYEKTNVEESQMLSLDYIDTHSSEEKRTFLDREGIKISHLFNPIIADPYETTIDLSSELRKVLIEMINKMNTISKFDTILSLLAFLYFIKDDRKRENHLYDLYGNTVKDKNEKIKIVFRNYLRSIDG